MGNSLAETRIETALKNAKISYIREYPIPGTSLRLDFFLPNLKVFVEVNGIQHFKFGKYSTPKSLEALQDNDFIKRKWAWKFGYYVVDINGFDMKDVHGKILKLMAYLRKKEFVSWKVI